MSLITDGYREQNRLLHEQCDVYGVSGVHYAEMVFGLIALHHPHTVIDFGCGKDTLRETVYALVQERYAVRGKFTKPRDRNRRMTPSMPIWRSYDPSIPELSMLPETPADMMICTDVMEHVERECLSEVIGYLRDMTKKVIFCSIAMKPACRKLPDGRNTHRIIKKKDFWMEKFSSDFHIVELPWRTEHNFVFVGYKQC